MATPPNPPQDSGQPGKGKRTFEIFVGDIKETWHEAQVLASAIMEQAGVSASDNLVLEALDKHNGKSVKEFKPADTVNLEDKDRKFFRIAPGGGGYS